MDGLIVKQPWVDLIVKGKKILEVRGQKTTKINERIAIIGSHTNKIFGSVKIAGCEELDKKLYNMFRKQHLIDLTYEEVLKTFGYKKLYGWFLMDEVEAAEPITCNNRKKGQVIWVKDAFPDDMDFRIK